MFFLLCALARAGDPIAPAGTLDRDALVAVVLAQNPGLAEAQAALAAARAQVPRTWSDPMLELMVAPGGAAMGMPGARARLEQPLPGLGMPALARDMVAAEVDAEGARLAMMRRDMARMATMAFVDWWAMHEEIALMEEAMDAADAARDAALARYGTGLGGAADALAFSAESAAILAEHHLMEFEREAMGAQLNLLLHRAPDAPLPPPPDALPALADPPAAAPRRPEAAEADAMVAMAEVEVAMARRERLPMLGVMAEWDTMAPMPEERGMVGIAVELPLAQRRRAAAVDVAEAERARAVAERARMLDELALAEEVARLRLDGQLARLSVIERELLPAAQARVDASRAAFAAGTGEVQGLLDAERGLRDARLLQVRAAAGAQLHAADLALLLTGGAP